MNNKNLIIIISVIIGAAVFLGTGYLIGVSLEKEKTKPHLEKLEKVTNVLNSFGSLKIVASIAAFGEVKQISDRIITLNYGTENLPIRIKEDAKISSFIIKNNQNVPEQKNAEFKDIKVGDSLNVSLRVLPDGELEGLSVIIFSPALYSLQ